MPAFTSASIISNFKKIFTSKKRPEHVVTEKSGATDIDNEGQLPSDTRNDEVKVRPNEDKDFTEKSKKEHLETPPSFSLQEAAALNPQPRIGLIPAQMEREHQEKMEEMQKLINLQREGLERLLKQYVSIGIELGEIEIKPSSLRPDKFEYSLTPKPRDSSRTAQPSKIIAQEEPKKEGRKGRNS